MTIAVSRVMRQAEIKYGLRTASPDPAEPAEVNPRSMRRRSRRSMRSTLRNGFADEARAGVAVEPPSPSGSSAHTFGVPAPSIGARHRTQSGTVWRTGNQLTYTKWTCGDGTGCPV